MPARCISPGGDRQDFRQWPVTKIPRHILQKDRTRQDFRQQSGITKKKKEESTPEPRERRRLQSASTIARTEPEKADCSAGGNKSISCAAANATRIREHSSRLKAAISAKGCPIWIACVLLEQNI
eukprot:3404422-Rhodomonas_salina.1